jgi:signal-transduction protein with cAMP-binding, CBS, and nucleotidyltransferase domain
LSSISRSVAARGYRITVASTTASAENPRSAAPSRPNASPLKQNSAREACQCVRDRRVGAVLVTEGDQRLVGIFTGRDAVHRVLAEGKSAARTKLTEVMTRDPDTMPPGKTAIEALRLMQDGRYRHVPIVDGGKVVGIVSRFDFSGIELDRLDEETGLWKRI